MRNISTLSFGRSSASAAMAVLGLFLLATVTCAAERSAPSRPAAKSMGKKSAATTAARTGTEDSPRQTETGQKEQALLGARLETGEFGPAVDAAGAIRDPGQRADYLKKIVAAERDAGEYQAAAATASRIPVPEERAATRSEVARERNALNGGSMANPTWLINLIKNTIGNDDDWTDNGGKGEIQWAPAGVHVDPNGVMRQLSKEEKTGALESLARRARFADLNDDMSRASGLRLVSLKRLEQGVSGRLEAGLPVLETMQRLAGLTHIQYVFVYPDDQELVIAGPAEGWKYDESGRPVGRETGRPMMSLDDFVVVLRTFAAGGNAEFGCSINTRDANMKAVIEFVEATNKSPLPPGKPAREKWFSELQKRLGLQDVVVTGVPATSHVAQVLVEADYRMKLIGVDKLGADKRMKEIPSYFDLLKTHNQGRGAPLEALRWWLTMKYDSLVHSPDRTSFEIQGSSVLVQSENQFVNAHGQHLPTGVSEPVNVQFAQNFTRHYNELAERDPVFADLRNIFDMALVAALCRQENLHEKSEWDLGSFGPAGLYQPAVAQAPVVVESVMNHRMYGQNIVVQVAGGVQTDMVGVVRDRKLAKEDAALDNVARRAKLPAVPEGRWWWDARE